MITPIHVPAPLAIPAFMLELSAFIMLLSLCSGFAVRGVASLPKWLSVPFLLPAVVWHECCHAIGCVLAGHRVIEVSFVGNAVTGRPPHVNYLYDRNSLWQVIGTLWVGWAPVLLSVALIVWLDHQSVYLEGFWRWAAIYGALVAALSMPLSAADWRCGVVAWVLLVLLGIPAGFVMFPRGIGVGLLVEPFSDRSVFLLFFLVVLGGLTRFLSCSARRFGSYSAPRPGNSAGHGEK